ncbi:adenylate/guanylate cyclase domain-containing protein [Candidatus Peregrinibacteria bacterium]|nr:adenylate/guanylate cyclase domain-containing protein [Candidatus Peregrinibacteria bacterium]
MKSKVALGIGILVFLLVSVLAFFNPLQVIQWKISDLFFRGRPVSDSITIIAVDEKSLSPDAGLGRFRDWPRSYYAQILKTINAHKPAVVAFDFDFRERSRGISDFRLSQLLREYERRIANSPGAGMNWYETLKLYESVGATASTNSPTNSQESLPAQLHPSDEEFQDTLDASGPVVFFSTLLFPGSAAEESTEFPQPESTQPPIFRGENVRTGYANVFRDRDGVLRRFAPWALIKGEATGTQSFPIAIANAYMERGEPDVNSDAELGADLIPIINATDPAELQKMFSGTTPQTLINYAAKPFSYRTISFVDAKNGIFEPAAIEGKIVLIGATARSLQDFQTTPTSRNRMPGVEVIANIVQQILDMKMAREQGIVSLWFILLLMAIGGAAVLSFVSLRILGIVFGATLVGYPFLAYGMYQTGTVLNVVYPEAAWIITGLAVLWYRNKTELKAKREIKRAFSHYVSPVVVNELVRNPDALKLGGKREQISVMFSDIVGFTTLAEKLSPEDTVALLNDYLTAMTEVIFGYSGTLDKYQGDAIMALFGAPVDDPHRAVNACSAALGMRMALVTLHEKWNNIPQLPMKDELINLDFRVGIATGPAVVGNVGSEKRFDYTAIGDIVNLGSRLESINRKYGTRVIVDKGTFTAVTENHNPFIFRKLDTVRVKGKEKETEIFEVVGFTENVPAETKPMLDDFENGRILYTQRNFIEAKQYFEAALARVKDDGPSQIYRNRCNFYLRKPPGREWSAVVNLEEK